MAKDFEFDVPTFSPKLYQLDEMLRFYIGTYIETEAKANAPYRYSEEKGITDHYRDKIQKNDNNTAVIAHANYSAFIEYGTQPHTIEARTKQALHFLISGKDVFTKRVKHPGTKPNPVMRNAARTVMKRDFNRAFKDSYKATFGKK